MLEIKPNKQTNKQNLISLFLKNIIPGSAVKEPGPGPGLDLDLDWIGEIRAPLIINGNIKGIITFF